MRQIQRGQRVAEREHAFHSRYICRGEFARVPRQRRHGTATCKHAPHRRNTAGIQKLKVHFGAIVQIFKPEERSYYNLEKLWGDSPEVDITAIIED